MPALPPVAPGHGLNHRFRIPQVPRNRYNHAMPSKSKPPQWPSFLQPSGDVFTSVQNCARCGETHIGLTFKKLRRPVNKSTHWCPCPATHEPILMHRVKNLGKKKAVKK